MNVHRPECERRIRQHRGIGDAVERRQPRGEVERVLELVVSTGERKPQIGIRAVGGHYHHARDEHRSQAMTMGNVGSVVPWPCATWAQA